MLRSLTQILRAAALVVLVMLLCSWYAAPTYAQLGAPLGSSPAPLPAAKPAATPAATAKPAASVAAPATQTSQNTFIPLTNLPGVADAGNAATLPKFLNSLYKLCIGAAAVIAVLQIMRAGVYFMFNKGSVAQNEQGKSLIQNSVLGLVLVLSPAIVFGIINPDILKLHIDLSKLQPKEGSITNNDLSTINQLQCSAYVKPVETCDTSGTSNMTTTCNPNATCPDGQVKTPDPTCCDLKRTGSVCCAQIPKDLYLIAFTYLRENNDGTKCRVSYKNYYASLVQGAVSDPSGTTPSGCDAAVTESFINKQNGVVAGSLQMIKSCEKTSTPYVFPDNLLTNQCAAQTAPAGDSPTRITVLSSFNGGNMTINDFPAGASQSAYDKFYKACKAGKGTPKASVDSALVECNYYTPVTPWKGSGRSCKLASLTCAK